MQASGLLLCLLGLLALSAVVTSDDHKEICHLPQDPGECLAYIPRYYYNSKTQKCEQFIYGGCKGNENNFKTLTECRHTCEEKPGTCPTPPKGTPTTCDIECKNDWWCPKNKKCCPYGCRIGCYDPVK